VPRPLAKSISEILAIAQGFSVLIVCSPQLSKAILLQDVRISVYKRVSRVVARKKDRRVGTLTSPSENVRKQFNNKGVYSMFFGISKVSKDGEEQQSDS
jgi:hypothetical protein